MKRAHYVSLWESGFGTKKAPLWEYTLHHALCNVGSTIFGNCCAITYLLTNGFNRKCSLCRQCAPVMHEQIQPEGLVFWSVQLSHPCPSFWVNFTSPINRLNLCTLSAWSLIKYLQVTMGLNLYWLARFRSIGWKCEEHPYCFPLLQTAHAFIKACSLYDLHPDTNPLLMHSHVRGLDFGTFATSTQGE